MKTHKTSKAGGPMHKSMLKPGERGTARPAKAKVMSAKDEPRKRMMPGPGMKKWDKAK